jgi:hypothetical protein
MLNTDQLSNANNAYIILDYKYNWFKSFLMELVI